MNDDDKRMKASFQHFDGLKCCLTELTGYFGTVTALALMSEDKMKRLIVNYLAALFIVQIERILH